MSKLLETMRQSRESILQDWLTRLKSAVQRRDLISERDLASQASEMVATLVDVPPGTAFEDFNSPAWQPLKAMLASLSVSRAMAGFTPSETAKGWPASL
jgi:rsbT co-antagonist protein RsbR